VYISLVFAADDAHWGRHFPTETHAAESSNTVRIGYPSSAVSTLPFDIAKEKSFYSKAALNVEYIQMRSALGPQAILNGNIQFFTSRNQRSTPPWPVCRWWSCCPSIGILPGF
jgi:hypothetical protein